jgi:hypothetical protein
MASLASRIRARFNYIFPSAPSAPAAAKPGPSPPNTAFDPESKVRRRVVFDPIHPDFLEKIDPLWPISEEALKKNRIDETSMTRKLHPHTAFGKHGFGVLAIPETMTQPIKKLVDGNTPAHPLSFHGNSRTTSSKLKTRSKSPPRNLFHARSLR